MVPRSGAASSSSWSSGTTPWRGGWLDGSSSAVPTALLSASLDTLLGLGAFVEHQILLRWLVRDHLDAAFQHEQQSLHVDLNLCNACPQRVAEYRLEVPFINTLKVLINLKKIPAMLMGEVMNDYHAKTGSAAAAAPLRWLHLWFLTLGQPHPKAGHPGPLPGVAGGWMALAALYPRHPLLLCCSPNLLPHCDCHLQDPQDLGALGLEGLQHWARVHNLAIQSWTTLVKMSVNPLITFLPSPHS
ncbi:uncharacterized protein LOC144116282 isoform X1 [Amblyomma americanum]